jgi:hypothetical protein
MAGLLAIAFPGAAPTANADSVGQSVLKSGKIAKYNAVHMRKRGCGPRIYLPIGPSYRYYDYPYYYSRGHYPTHIGPGLVYFGYPYAHYRSCYWGQRRGPGSPGRRKARRS